MEQGVSKKSLQMMSIGMKDMNNYYESAARMNNTIIEYVNGMVLGGTVTLAKLLVHYYDLNSGKIKIGGQDITDMTLKVLNDQVAYVSQEQFLFTTSLYENILIGRPDATREEVLDFAEGIGIIKSYNMLGDKSRRLTEEFEKSFYRSRDRSKNRVR